MRAIYIKTVIETELSMDILTEQEKVDLILELIKDVNCKHPDYNLFLYKVKQTDLNTIDDNLNW